MSRFIKPITTDAAIAVASDLREADRRELVEGHGLDPLAALPLTANDKSNVYFTVPDGRIAGLAGVNEEGQIWMLCTKAIEDFPHTFAREAKRFVNRQHAPLLWNIVDKRNTVHLKLLRFLGFNFLREVKYGPNDLTFIEFCRVRSSTRGT